jgi:hypothetical protein
VLIVVLVSLAIWWFSRTPPVYLPAYIAESDAILWNANAQVRQPVTTLHYGDRVSVLRRSGEQAEVRTDAGARGWLESRVLMDAELWQLAAALLESARDMPVQARGQMRTISNVRLNPGRNGPRIHQFARGDAIVVLERSVVEAPANAGDTTQTTQTEAAPSTRSEDWLLVLRDPPAGAPPAAAGAPETVPVAGWVLGRFVELQPPAPILNLFTGSGLDVAAWADLSSVADPAAPEGRRTQYLAAGTRGGEGQLCDFTLLRVYTWSTSRQRYETAFVENNICGRMPIRVTPTSAGVDFQFTDPSQNGADVLYRMRQTTVRRVREAPSPAQP